MARNVIQDSFDHLKKLADTLKSNGGGNNSGAARTPVFTGDGRQALSQWADGAAGGGGGYVAGGGGGDGGYAAAAAAANAKRIQESRDRSARENQATREAAAAKLLLIPAYAKARDTKLANIKAGQAASDAMLLKNYGAQAQSLLTSRRDNDKAEGDSTYLNLVNMLRERGDALTQASALGAGETDRLQAQLGALRNLDANQKEINRSFFDTLTSVNRSVTGLNTETATGRKSIWDQAESDREAAIANYHNQMSQAYTEIANIENANTNIETEDTVGYEKIHTGAAQEAANHAGSSYTKKKADVTKLSNWAGQAKVEGRNLANSNAQVIDLGKATKAPEGATLRKW